MFPSIYRVLCLVFLSLFTASCGQQGGSSSSSKTPEGPFKIESLEAKREGDHVHLRILVAGENRGKEPLHLSANSLPLMSGKDAVPPFVRPFISIVVIPPGKSGKGSVDYWVNKTLLQQPLSLTVGGQNISIKAAAGFSIDQLPEGKTVVLSCPDWRIL